MLRPVRGDGSDLFWLPPPLRSSFACMDDEELKRLSNHHASLAPVIEERPGRYLGYFENKFGEQLVFVHDDGESDAVVLLGDLGWEPCRVSDTGGLPDVGDVILNDEERAFVNACWMLLGFRSSESGSGPCLLDARDFLGCGRGPLTWVKLAGDYHAAELGEHVSERRGGFGEVPGGACAVLADDVGVMP